MASIINVTAPPTPPRKTSEISENRTPSAAKINDNNQAHPLPLHKPYANTTSNNAITIRTVPIAGSNPRNRFGNRRIIRDNRKPSVNTATPPRKSRIA